jgi:hypothetical protein
VVVSLATVSVVTWALLNSGQERRAALIYQHATRERDEEIATAMGEVLASVRRKGTTGSRSGT